MKIEFENLGIIGYAGITLSDLTVICGKNNTGKTYVTHALYGLFDYLRGFTQYTVDRDKIDELIDKGVVSLPMPSPIQGANENMRTVCAGYDRVLYKVLAGPEKRFKNVKVRVTLDPQCDQPSMFEFRSHIKIGENKSLHATYDIDKGVLQIELSYENDHRPTLSEKHRIGYNYQVIQTFISDVFRRILMESTLPRPFISSVERTGAAIFQKELDFTASGLLELIRNSKDNGLNLSVFMRGFSGRYPLAVRRNVDFIRDLSSIANRESFIVKQHPEILRQFADIVGGTYQATKDGIVQYCPGTKKNTVKLALVESSSAVRSLLDVGFYLRHLATPGDLFMIDEPELNLHPENQRRLARLFACLVNCGIKVFMTTHSDYIIKEFNTLLMLNQHGTRFSEVAKREGYSKNELLKVGQIRVYLAKTASVLRPGAKRKTLMPTLIEAEVTQNLGASVPTFDDTIDEMNRIQDEIMWGASNGDEK